MQEKWMRLWTENKKTLLICMAAVMILGLAAHGYTMLNFQLSHDSLDGLYAAGRENAHKIELGRVLAPAYRYLFRGQFAMPWLTGLLAFVWIGLAAWMTMKVLEVRSVFQMVLICGLMTANLTITALCGTFIHDFDQNMFCMMMACLAVLVWKYRPRGWMLWGAIGSAICLGIYQAFISVAIGLIMIVMIMRLLNGEKWTAVVWDGILGAVMVGIGGVLFFVLLKGVLAMTDIPIAQRNNSLYMLKLLGLDDIPGLVKGIYRNFWDYFRNMPNTWLAPKAAALINCVLFGFAGLALTVGTLIRKQLSLMSRLLVMGIAALLPLGLNVCYLLTSGFVHHLMQYAFILIYILCLLLAREICQKLKERIPACRFVQAACSALVLLIVWSGVQTANTYHFQKTSTVMATRTHMTGVYHDMLEEGYIPGETPLVVVGEVPIAIPAGFEETTKIWPGWYPNAITSDHKSIRSYFSFVFGDRAAFCTEEEWAHVTNDLYVQDMPCYPNDGYVDYLDEVMVVKLS